MNSLLLEEILKNALKEDIGFGDVTNEAIFAQDHRSVGVLIAKQDLILAGLDVFRHAFLLLDKRTKVISEYKDGAFIKRGQEFAVLEGFTRVLLSAERVALNLLQHMSGIATQTRLFTEAAKEYKAVIVDTRKTTPGLRMLEKYAVAAGGGKNHRYRLESMVMIKDNHIKAAGGILPAVRLVRDSIAPFMKIEVEVESVEQVKEALAASVDVIMLDNMPIELIRASVSLINGQALVEVSGNVTLGRVAELAAAGVDIISSGALTHSVQAADISLRLR